MSLALAALVLAGACAPQATDPPAWLAAFDAWFEAPPHVDAPMEPLLAAVREAGISMEEAEGLLRAHSAHVLPEEPHQGTVTRGALPSLHTDVVGELLTYAPKSVDLAAARRLPVVVVGHGGNSAMSADYARRAALSMLDAWKGAAEEHGFLLAAPTTRYGWGPTGYSLVLSALRDLRRHYPVDPDRVFLTGHSMGGHLTYRAALTMADRWAAVAPMSGGYDFVEKGSIARLWNVPGIATWATSEPYGIGADNARMRTWMEAHGFPWRHLVGEGHHTIFPDHVATIATFFDATRRDLYRSDVYAAAGGRMVYDTPWSIERDVPAPRWRPGAEIPLHMTHWVGQHPREGAEGEPAPPQAVRARVDGQTIRVLSRGARRLTLHLHPAMLDLDAPVRVEVNGQVVHDGPVARDWTVFFGVMRAHDDRGRIFHAALEVEVATDVDVPVPGVPAGEEAR